MTAKQLIAKLRTMPPDAEVGFSSHDNSEYEVQGWALHVDLKDKAEAPVAQMSSDELRNLARHPRKWITIRC